MRESAASKLSINQEANRISSPKMFGMSLQYYRPEIKVRKKGALCLVQII